MSSARYQVHVVWSGVTTSHWSSDHIVISALTTPGTTILMIWPSQQVPLKNLNIQKSYFFITRTQITVIPSHIVCIIKFNPSPAGSHVFIFYFITISFMYIHHHISIHVTTRGTYWSYVFINKLDYVWSVRDT